jgi:hypothetical protein
MGGWVWQSHIASWVGVGFIQLARAEFGPAERYRPHPVFLTMEVLYQLSYPGGSAPLGAVRSG